MSLFPGQVKSALVRLNYESFPGQTHEFVPWFNLTRLNHEFCSLVRLNHEFVPWSG